MAVTAEGQTRVAESEPAAEWAAAGVSGTGCKRDEHAARTGRGPLARWQAVQMLALEQKRTAAVAVEQETAGKVERKAGFCEKPT